MQSTSVFDFRFQAVADTGRVPACVAAADGVNVSLSAHLKHIDGRPQRGSACHSIFHAGLVHACAHIHHFLFGLVG